VNKTVASTITLLAWSRHTVRIKAN